MVRNGEEVKGGEVVRNGEDEQRWRRGWEGGGGA